MKSLIGFGLAAILIWGGGAAVAQVPDSIFVNGKIVTVDEAFSIAEAVAVAGGRILAVGSNGEVRALAGPGTAILDLGGRTVIPGLIDNHNHMIRATEYWASEARLDGVAGRAEALEIVAARAATLSAGEWLFTLGGWSENQFMGERASFTLAELDAVAPANPVFLQVQYDHALVNSAWLRAMGLPVTATAAQIAAATGLAADTVRDAAGRATGRLEGGFPMIGRAIARFPAVTEAGQIAGIKAAMAYYNSIGLTTVFDSGGLGIRDASYARIQALADRGELSLRIFHALWGGLFRDQAGITANLLARLASTRPFQGNDWYDRVAMGEVYHQAFHWDGLTRPISPTPGDIAVARKILTAAAAGGWPVQTHAVRPETIDRLFDVMEDIDKSHPLRHLRWSVTHADMAGPAQIARARALGVNFQLRSYRVISGFDGADEAYGEAAYAMPPLRLAQDSGMTWGLGSDGTKAAQINPFVTLWYAITGKTLAGQVITKGVLSRTEALIAHTRANAPMIFREDRLGVIRPGFLADMVVLDRDYMTVGVDEIRQIRPVATIVNGRVVYGEIN